MLVETMHIDPGEELNRTVTIDESVGRDTKFMFSYLRSPPTLDFKVISPRGQLYTLNGPNRYSLDGANMLGIRIENTTEVRT